MDNARGRHFIFMTTEILTRRRFCELLASGGKVFDAGGSDGVWSDETGLVAVTEKQHIRRLERLRQRLYPDLAAGLMAILWDGQSAKPGSEA